MNERRKIVINIFATYIRSAITFFVALLSSRWLLIALGEIDYGLYGLIGGMTIFISFINSLMSTAVSRFYAIAEGERNAGVPDAEKRIMEWFNSAFLIHLLLPTLLLIAGYPIGIYAIHNWLTIPGDRIAQCIWVFRFSCLACYSGMVSVPFSAMFIAKQRIAEYSLYITGIPIINIIFVYYIYLHKEDWLVRYTCFYSCLIFGVQFLISLRAFKIFPECKIRNSMLWNKDRIRSLTCFAGWSFFGNFGELIQGQGLSILGNIQFGPIINASLTIANKVSAQACILSAGLKNAFAPAITNAYGAKEYDKMKKYTKETNRVGTLLILLLALPLSLETNKLFELWLKDPPIFSQNLCVFILVSLVIDKTTSGHMLAINASGRIALYQAGVGIARILTLPLAFILIEIGFGIMSIGYAILITSTIVAFERVYFGKKILLLSIKEWFIDVFFPVSLVSLISVGIGYLPHFFFQESIKRILLSTCLSETIFAILLWSLVLNTKEKAFIKKKTSSLFFLKTKTI